MCTEMSHVHRMFGNIITLSPPFTHFLFPRKTRVNIQIIQNIRTFSNLLSFSQEQETQKSVNGEQSV